MAAPKLCLTKPPTLLRFAGLRGSAEGNVGITIRPAARTTVLAAAAASPTHRRLRSGSTTISSRSLGTHACDE